MSKFKLAFIVLSIATIVWATMFHVTLEEYREYREQFYEQWEKEWAGPEELKDMYGLTEPWWGFNYMLFILIGGLVLLCLWVDFVIVGVRKLRDKRRRVKTESV